LVFWSIGEAMHSGTLEALAYDSLQELGEDKHYERVIANLNSIRFLSPALCSLIGGFLYAKNPQLPYLLNACCAFLGIGLAWILIEPKIDSEQFSLKTYVSQTKQGLKQLFASTNITKQTILLLSVGLVMIMTDNMINALLGVEFGFSEQLMGLLWGLFYLLAALASQLTRQVQAFFPNKLAIFIVGFVVATILLLSPLLGLILGALAILLLYVLQAIQSNLASIIINRQTPSKYRVTTLSTFNMLQNIPYVLSAYLIASFANQYSAKFLAFCLGAVLLLLLLLQSVTSKKSLNKS